MIATELTCPSCATANKPTAKFCKKCGTALSRTCPNCSAGVDSDDAFCPECGFELTSAPSADEANRERLRQYIPDALLKKL